MMQRKNFWNATSWKERKKQNGRTSREGEEVDQLMTREKEWKVELIQSSLKHGRENEGYNLIHF